jgi:lipoprotein-anchoring transpeptidase ErfK/SrfK
MGDDCSMQRCARLSMVILLWWMMIFPAPGALLFAPRVGATGTPASLHVSVILTQATVVQGDTARLQVHTGAFTRLTLQVLYTGHVISTMFGTADGRGRFTFRWRVPDSLHIAGRARLRVMAQRGSATGAWSGILTIDGPRLPPVFVAPLSTRVIAGDPVGFFVGTAPHAMVHYSVMAAGTVVARGVARADSAGRLVVQVPETALPRSQIKGTITVTVQQRVAARTRRASFLIEPRPPLALTVTPLSPVFRAGLTLGLAIQSVPGASVTITVSVTSTVIAQSTAEVGGDGRYTFVTGLNLVLRQSQQARILVQARHGLDSALHTLNVMVEASIPGQIIDTLNSPSNPAPSLAQFISPIPDKLIMVSTESQTLRAYQDGVLVHESYVTTGRPELPTVQGIFHVYEKVTPFEFISPWPTSSPWYYPPSWVKYWMPFYGGYGLHDAPWRTVYGPGTNLPHYDTDPGEPFGSHGCVNIPLADMTWLWNWTTVGTTVVVY